MSSIGLERVTTETVELVTDALDMACHVGMPRIDRTSINHH